jgi:Ca2+-binding RTX toxin-like protein
VSARRSVAACFAGILLAALAWPAASLADHISITASVFGQLKERWTKDSWIVEVTWTATCQGAGAQGASFVGNLYLVDVDTGDRTYLGGVSSATGKAEQIVYVKAREQHLQPELQISCFDNATLHGSGTITVHGANTSGTGGIVVIPARYDDGEGGYGGGGGGNDPTQPMRNGGCRVALQGTDKPETLTGTDAGDIIFGYGGADRIRGAAHHDCLLGGRGSDTLRGEGGDDRLTGGSGADVLIGGPGTNAYDAGKGNDVVQAVNGRREVIRCGAGKDRARVDRRDRVYSCERVTRVG